MKQVLVVGILVGLLGIGSVVLLLEHQAGIKPAPVACTMEAKICPDGTAVGRTGPNCEFAACPVAATTTTTTPSTTTADIEVHKDLIVVDSLQPGSTITSPLAITGKARGNWYFEGSFPIVVTDWDGRIIAEGHGDAQSDWMTTDFVPFSATLTFNAPTSTVSDRGAVIFRKDNPSGLPQNDDALEIPVMLATSTESGLNTGDVTGSGGNTPPKGSGPTICPAIAKACPDGSYVSPEGPNCEFAACPSSIAPYVSGIDGTVFVGPTCPVMQQDNPCPDRPLATDISISYVNSSSVFVTAKSDENGHFRVNIPPGEYIIHAGGTSTLPRCTDARVTVTPRLYTFEDITCDSGIR